MGFDFRSVRFDEDLAITGVADDDIECPETGIDGLTDKVRFRDSLKFAMYEGPPSRYGTYVGFVPYPD